MLGTTPYLFFTGKGGVGKTSLACATAIQLADEGRKVLIISTDPASNLEDVLESKVSEEISQVSGLENLYAININPEVSAEEYRDRVTAPLVDILPEAEIRKMKEELSGACTTEVAAFDEFSRFISGEYEGIKFDVIIFDTAPTGHTLRLLELPSLRKQDRLRQAAGQPQSFSALGSCRSLGKWSNGPQAKRTQ